MSGLHSLIVDLALILILAGVTSLLFKWMKQPVVLGYIVAGFLAGPNFTLLPNITDIADINIWAEIGIIVLLFSLGLEFNIKKIAKVGVSAFITALIIVAGMMMLGYATGQLLHFSYLDSIFLGGMLSMSSTTIIIKAFTDLGLRKKKFTSIVFGILILEDIFAVLMMVVLTSIAVNKEFEGSALIFSVFKLIFFLVTWFTLGVFLIPTFLKKTRKYLNSETLLIVSMGLCLGMVVLANFVGFSSALGAFIMGSILAGTIQAERIEKVVKPVKNLFGAVFFISVGMLVNPVVLAQYWFPILMLSAVVIVGQIVFATGGLLISGKPLRVALQSGFSLAQIGEFAFIIATLGMTLKVIDNFLYPIVVAVSVITTFTTPYFIKMADPVCNWLQRKLPERVRINMDNYSASGSLIDNHRKVWRQIVEAFIGRILLYTILLLGIVFVSLNYFIPFVQEHFSASWTLHIAVFMVLLVMAPFIWALSAKRYKGSQLSELWQGKRSSQVPLFIMLLFRIFLALAIILYFFSQVYSYKTGLLLGFSTFILIIILFSKNIRFGALLIENRFMDNLNERELRKTGKKNNIVHNIHLAYMKVQPNCIFAGLKLKETGIHRDYGINIASIRRSGRLFNIPNGDMRLFPGDVIGVVGTNDQIQQFLKIIEPEEELNDTEEDTVRVVLEKIRIPKGSGLNNVKIRNTNLREKYACLVVGIERGEEPDFIDPDGDTVLKEEDWIWIVGKKETIQVILSE